MQRVSLLSRLIKFLGVFGVQDPSATHPRATHPLGAMILLAAYPSECAFTSQNAQDDFHGQQDWAIDSYVSL